MPVPNRSPMEPELRTTLGRHREELLRRALALAVSRASLDELIERPLGDRLDELELVFEAADVEGRESSRGLRRRDLHAELEQQLAVHGAEDEVFSVAVVTAGHARVARLLPGRASRRDDGPDSRAWATALRECAGPTDVVVDAGDGVSAVIFPGHDQREARVAVDRLCQAAWRLLGRSGPLAGAGVATYPQDGSSGTEILAAAYDELWRQAESHGGIDTPEPSEESAPHDGPPAPVHPLRPL